MFSILLTVAELQGQSEPQEVQEQVTPQNEGLDPYKNNPL